MACCGSHIPTRWSALVRMGKIHTRCWLHSARWEKFQSLPRVCLPVLRNARCLERPCTSGTSGTRIIWSWLAPPYTTRKWTSKMCVSIEQQLLDKEKRIILRFFIRFHNRWQQSAKTSRIIHSSLKSHSHERKASHETEIYQSLRNPWPRIFPFDRARRSISIRTRWFGNFSPKRGENWITAGVIRSIRSPSIQPALERENAGGKGAIQLSLAGGDPSLPFWSWTRAAAWYEQVSRTASGGTSTAKWFHRERVARELSRNVAGRQRGVACRGAAKTFSRVHNTAPPRP